MIAVPSKIGSVVPPQLFVELFPLVEAAFLNQQKPA